MTITLKQIYFTLRVPLFGNCSNLLDELCLILCLQLDVDNVGRSFLIGRYSLKRIKIEVVVRGKGSQEDMKNVQNIIVHE